MNYQGESKKRVVKALCNHYAPIFERAHIVLFPSVIIGGKRNVRTHDAVLYRLLNKPSHPRAKRLY